MLFYNVRSVLLLLNIYILTATIAYATSEREYKASAYPRVILQFWVDGSFMKYGFFCSLFIQTEEESIVITKIGLALGLQYSSVMNPRTG